MRRCIASTLLLATMLFSVDVANAQSADSMPRELALALLREPGGGVRLFVGTAPERFPFELTPVDSKLLGALQRELTATVVFVSTATVEKSLRDWERQLESAGWTRPVGHMPVATNGFMSSEAPASYPVFCLNGRFASLDGTARFDGGSTLLVQYSQPTTQSLCTVSRDAQATANAGGTAPDVQLVITRDTMPLPALLPPAGVTVVALSPRTSVDNWEQHASISGTLSPRVVLEHYAELLRRAGFAAGAPANLDATATQTFRRTLPGPGFELFVSIVVIANPFDTTSMDARLTLFRRR